MTQTKRDKLKRSLAQAHNDLDRAMANLLAVKAVFDEHHPDMGENLETLATLCLTVQQGILVFWAMSWGKAPGDIGAWRR